MPAEAKTEPTATRAAYGDALVELGEAHEEVVALDADLAVSTQSTSSASASRSASSTAAPRRRT